MWTKLLAFPSSREHTGFDSSHRQNKMEIEEERDVTENDVEWTALFAVWMKSNAIGSIQW